MTGKKSATSATKETGNTSTVSKEPQSRRWCLTLNNYTSDEYKELCDYATHKTKYFIIGKEIGEEKTPHLQCYFEYKGGTRFSSIKKINKRLHIEKTKRNRDVNVNYCAKENDFISNFPKHKMLLKYKNITWKNWQQEILKIIETKPDERTIHWVYDPIGNCGKSFLTKYIYLKYNCLITNGKSQDTFCQVLEHVKQYEEIKICIIDTPRCVEEKYISYQSIEKIKDGLLYSGKYEGGIACFDSPHVIIFSNHMPMLNKMSEDRWNIIQVSGTEEP